MNNEEKDFHPDSYFTRLSQNSFFSLFILHYSLFIHFFAQVDSIIT